jgi:rare lipoprotein A
MKTSKTGLGAGRAVLRGLLVFGVVAGLSGCSWIGSRFSDKEESTPAPAPAAKAPAVSSTLGGADAVPRDEPLHPTANKWYGANGRLYRPITDDREFKERGKATVFSADVEGKPTASGESYAPGGMTAAHSRLPIPSYARITDLRTGRSAIVRINDRGAYDRDEAIAISPAVAQKLGHANNDEVEVERITPAQIAAMPPSKAAAAAAPPPAPLPSPVAVASPQTAPAPAEPTPLAAPAAPAPAPAPAPVVAPAPAPVAAPAPAPVAAAPVAPAAAAAAPAAAAPRPAPAAAAAPPPTRAPGTQSATTGRWSVQVAAFATESMAESTRVRVAQQLAQNAPNVTAAPRVERYGNRSYVLVGDFADRDSAEALAGRLRAALRQDVVVERR